MLKFFRLPFATTGDKTAVPDAVDSNGNVSYSQGYGFDYQRQKTDPASKNIERDKMNQIFFDLTTAIAELQANGTPDFITTALNGGTAYSYAQYAVVKYSGDLYISLAAANTALPSDATKWALLPTPARIQAAFNSSAVAAGTADALTGAFSPAIAALPAAPGTLSVLVRAGSANATVTPTFKADGTTAKTIVKGNNLPLVAGDIAGAGHWLDLQYDATLDKWVLQNPAKGISTFTPTQIQSVSASVAANALTVGIAATSLDFRNATLTNGAPNAAVTVGALSLVVPSGATLGTINGIAANLVLLVAYNAGTPVLCIANLTGGLNFDETQLISPTTISAGATSASVIYSASAVAANSPFRIVGLIDIVEATAGTWATAPTLVQGAGGEAFKHINAITAGVFVPTTSGTSIDLTGIPSRAKRVTLLFNAVSTNGSSKIRVQLGAGSIENTGYAGSGSYIASVSVASAGMSAGFDWFDSTVAASNRRGSLTLTLMGQNTWIANGGYSTDDVGYAALLFGFKTLSGILDRIRLTTANGTDVFDAGNVVLLWE